MDIAPSSPVTVDNATAPWVWIDKTDTMVLQDMRDTQHLVHEMGDALNILKKSYEQHREILAESAGDDAYIRTLIEEMEGDLTYCLRSSSIRYIGDQIAVQVLIPSEKRPSVEKCQERFTMLIILGLILGLDLDNMFLPQIKDWLHREMLRLTLDIKHSLKYGWASVSHHISKLTRMLRFTGMSEVAARLNDTVRKYVVMPSGGFISSTEPLNSSAEPHTNDPAGESVFEGSQQAPPTEPPLSVHTAGSMFEGATNTVINDGTFVACQSADITIHATCDPGHHCVAGAQCPHWHSSVPAYTLLALQATLGCVGSHVEVRPPLLDLVKYRPPLHIHSEDLPFFFTPLLFLYLWKFVFGHRSVVALPQG